MIMIGFLRGKVHYFNNDYVLLDVSGVGYRINFHHPEMLKEGNEVIIYTYQSVTENDMSLFGFKTIEEYDLFVKLIQVNGVGPKTASNMLANDDFNSLIEAIENEDIDHIKSLPGIGNKTARQIILDLKGKLMSDYGSSTVAYEVEEALRALGYKTNEFKNIVKEFANENLEKEEYIKKVLSKLAK